MIRVPKLCRRSDGQHYSKFQGKREYFGVDPVLADQKFKRWVADVVVAQVSPVKRVNVSRVTMAELFAAYFREHPPTQQSFKYVRASRIVLAEAADTLTADFGPLVLKAIRIALIREGSKRERDADGTPLSRQYVNKVIGAVKTVVKWGAENQLVPPDVSTLILAVRRLYRRDADALANTVPELTLSERSPVLSVPDETIEATLPHLPPTIADMVRIQRLTGMRPSEVCEIRLSEIDRTVVPWAYRKRDHKNQWRGKSRIVYLGPKSQAILAPYISAAETDGIESLFSSIRAEAERLAKLRANRKTPVQPSQKDRRKPGSKRILGQSYTASAYAHRIAIACKKHGMPHWFPYQIRHAVAEGVRSQYDDLEYSAAVLGDGISASQIYARRNDELARRIATENG